MAQTDWTWGGAGGAPNPWGTFQTPTTTPVGGTNWAQAFNQNQPTQMPSSGLFQPPNWLTEPQGAVVRALQQQGYNPASFNPMVQQVIRNAENLSFGVLGRNILGAPGQNPGWSTQSPFWQTDLTNTQGMGQQLQDYVRQAMTGGQVLGGYDPRQLANIQPWVAASNAGTTNPSANVVAEFMYDPARAAKFASSLMFGGMPTRFREAAAAPMINLADYYSRLLERGELQDRTLIDVLLGTPAQQWRL